MVNSVGLSALPGELLVWFEAHARELPWRISPARRATGERPDPYRIWLSEIMLQQTTIAHATRYWLDFTRRWPTVEALASAEDEAVMAAWAGLGYYARARNLLKCARAVAASGGAFPQDRAELQKLPGIGPYTSGAIAAIAFDQRAAAVDGNVDRVFSRVLALKGEWAEEKERIKAEVEALVPGDRPGEFAEALMDLGATVCTPKSPNCLICPISSLCAARAEGEPERYPIKPKKTAKPKRYGHVLLLEQGGRILLVRRPEKGLLGGMLALPTDAWSEGGGDATALAQAHGVAAASLEALGEVRHVFTHFELTLQVWRGRGGDAGEGDWRAPRDVEGLPSVFAKAFRLAYPSRPI
ncbi:MAG: A/G-specific adenine glycosylase, partial [Pseudomonadota bacterium]